MTYTVQELALQYAETLVAYHELNQMIDQSRRVHGLSHTDAHAMRMVRNNMIDAQNALDAACKRQVALNG